MSMDNDAELQHRFMVWLENCHLQLAVADGKDRLRAEMVALAGLLAAPRGKTGTGTTRQEETAGD